MESIFGPVPNIFVNIEPPIINENWPRFNTISDVNFTVNCLLVPCTLSRVNVKPTSLSKLFCDYLKSTWKHVNNILSRPLTNITKSPQYAVTCNFSNSIQADINFRHCLSPYCFSDQVVTSCMGLLIKGPWFTFAHMENGGSASFAVKKKGIIIWCASTSSTGTRLFDRCCHSPEGFIELMQRGPREREARHLRFTFQRPGNLIYFPHLAHAVSTVDTGSPRILSGWDAATTSIQQIMLQTLDAFTFALRCGRRRKLFRKKSFINIMRVGDFSSNRPPGK